MNSAEFALLEMSIYIEEDYIKSANETLADPNAKRASKAQARYGIADSKKKLKELYKQRQKEIDASEVKP